MCDQDWRAMTEHVGANQASTGARARAPRPGTPSLLRELNDRAALESLLGGRPLTRAQLSERTGVSKVTVAQMLARLQERGLVTAVGAASGGRGPNAQLYSVVPSSAYAAALYVEQNLVSTAVADVTGRVIAEVRDEVPPSGGGDPVELVRSAVDRACARAGLSVDLLSAFVIGSPGVVDPVSGDPQLAINLPAWHSGVLAALRSLHKNVLIENDVNLAAIAEHTDGAAVGADDFALLWIGAGIGLATVLGGRLHRGVSGAAGEIGWLPVPGAPVAPDVRMPASGGLQWLAGADTVRAVAAEYGIAPAGTGGTPAFVAASAGEAVHAAVAAADSTAVRGGHADAASADASSAVRAGQFLDELARRVALGATAICTVIDPGLVVLGGEIGLAGGTALASRVAAEVARICPVRPRVVPTAVASDPVLRGALFTAVQRARADLLASVGD
jgi:predicted NBD/HSP70 family sugar kinase